jgi:hypothetical protein
MVDVHNVKREGGVSSILFFDRVSGLLASKFARSTLENYDLARSSLRIGRTQEKRTRARLFLFSQKPSALPERPGPVRLRPRSIERHETKESACKALEIENSLFSNFRLLLSCNKSSLSRKIQLSIYLKFATCHNYSTKFTYYLCSQ